MRWLRYIAVTLATLGLALAMVGATYEALAWRADARRFPEPGRLVHIGEYRLKLNCTGAGTPAVMLESGLGDVSIEWQPVQAEVAKFARVCSYDRAGYGGSDAGPMPHTSARIAEELHALLTNAGERPPYVLVGHSFGGYNVRVFHGRFPNEVAGMVLVDAVQEDEYEVLPPVWNRVGAALEIRFEGQARWAPVVAGLGVGRLQLRARGQDEDSYLYLQSKYLRARASELREMRVSAEQARASGGLGDKPLIVVTAGNEPTGMARLSRQDLDEYQRIWAGDLQLRLAHLSSRGKQEIVDGSGHNIPAERPQAIVNAIREVRAEAVAAHWRP